MSVAPAAYLSPSGKPLLRPSVTGFLDVLGFSHLSTTSASLDESQRLLDKVAAAICDARAFARSMFADRPLADASRFSLKFFSDNLAFGLPVDPNGESPADAAWFAVSCVQRYQLRMALSGFFVRGAMTLGPICLTDDIIFGSALVECYRLESKTSIVPRAVLTEPLMDVLSHSTPSAGTAPHASDAICRDIDGWWFVNYLEAARSPGGIDWQAVEQHKTSVLASLATTTQHDVLPKFGWACRYHNVFCHWNRNDPGFSNRYRIDRNDEHSTIHRLGDLSRGKD